MDNSTFGLMASGPTGLHKWDKIPSEDDCDFVHYVNVSLQCAFVNATESCHINEGIIDYTMFVYCHFRASLLPLSVTLLFGWLSFLFISLATTADDFFCPALEVMAKTMRMSDNIAGVTLLAFGNGAPDVFSAISAVANMKNNDVGLVFGALLGAGVFLTTVVVGAVCMVGPFHAMERPFLRDLIFYIGTVLLTFSVSWDGKITLLETSFYFIIYIVYVAVVVIGRLVYQWQKRRDAAQRPLNGSIAEVEEEEEERSVLRSGGTEDTDGGCEAYVVPNGYSVNNPLLSDSTSSLHDNIYDVADETTPLVAVRAPTIVVQREICLPLLNAISPIDVEQFKKGSCIKRAYDIFKAPALFVIKLTTPVVDNRSPPLKNWCKPLQMIQCIITPVFIIFAADSETALMKVGGVFFVWIFFLIAGCLLAVLVFFTSSNHVPPIYHPAFAFVGFVAAVMWIKMIANEIVNLLQTGGLVFYISTAILGLTFLAWGNSIGDVIADVAMSIRGYPRAGISACFGGPLFNTLLGIGIPFSRKIWKDGQPIEVKLTNIQMLLFSAVGLSLIYTLIVVPIMRFRLNRIYGLTLILFYVVFLVVAILVEREIIRWG